MEKSSDPRKQGQSFNLAERDGDSFVAFELNALSGKVTAFIYHPRAQPDELAVERMKVRQTHMHEPEALPLETKASVSAPNEPEARRNATP